MLWINIDGLELLKEIYGAISITPEISNEYGKFLPNWIIVEAVLDAKKIELLQLELDLGEASAIALAVEKENSLLIIDERKGRAVAKRMGIKITGILGLLIKAKELGKIENVKPFLEKLENVNFRVSPKLKVQILKKVNEGI